MSKFLPEKFIWWLSLIGPAMVLWHREPGDTFWGHTAPWSVSLYFGFLVFVALYRWFDGFLRRKVQSYGDPLQHGIDKLKQSNLKLRKKACNTSSPEAMAGLMDRRVAETGRLTVRTVVDMMTFPAAGFTALEIGIRYYLWRFSSDYSYEADYSGPLLDELAYGFGKLGFWSVVFGLVGVLVYRSRGVQEFIWDVLPDDVAEKWKEMDRLRRENRKLRTARKEAKRARFRT